MKARAAEGGPRRGAVEMVATGSELLNGRTVNRHVALLARELAPLGFFIERETAVPDDRAAVADAVRGALERVDVVFVSGGLGPTTDDVTREAVAECLGRKLVMDEPSRERIRKLCEQGGREFSEARARQALILEGAMALPNRVGAAPGEVLAWNGKVLFLLPGPPDEFEAVLREGVLPWLAARGGGTELPAERIFMLSGIAEADILSGVEAMGLPAEVRVAYCAAPGRVEVRLSGSAAGTQLDRAITAFRKRFGPLIYAEERVELEEAVGRALTAARRTLATAESCTGGLLGHLITRVSGSSAYYLGGIVAYANAAKVAELGVDPNALAAHGAVSEAVARQMAAGARTRFRADYGLGVTGIAGPTGGTPEKPVGLVFIAVADMGGVAAKRFRFTGDRERIKEWSARAALDLLRLRLQGLL